MSSKAKVSLKSPRRCFLEIWQYFRGHSCLKVEGRLWGCLWEEALPELWQFYVRGCSWRQLLLRYSPGLRDGVRSWHIRYIANYFSIELDCLLVSTWSSSCFGRKRFLARRSEFSLKLRTQLSKVYPHFSRHSLQTDEVYRGLIFTRKALYRVSASPRSVTWDSGIKCLTEKLQQTLSLPLDARQSETVGISVESTSLFLWFWLRIDEWGLIWGRCRSWRTSDQKKLD